MLHPIQLAIEHGWIPLNKQKKMFIINDSQALD